MFGCAASHGVGGVEMQMLPAQKNGADLARWVGAQWQKHRAERLWQILVNVGPGSFTGLKVGLGTVHALQDWIGHAGVQVNVAGIRSTVALWIGAGCPTGAIAALSANPGRTFIEVMDAADAAQREPDDTYWTHMPEPAPVLIAQRDQAAAEQLRALGRAASAVTTQAIARGIMERAQADALGPLTVAAEPCYARQPRIDTSNDWRKRMLGWDTTEPTAA